MNIRRKRGPRIHNAADPCTLFAYDNLGRLTIAKYGIADTNEVFIMDDLGNRDMVNVRDGNYIDEGLSGVRARFMKTARRHRLK